MARIEGLADHGAHISKPWRRTVAGAQRVIMVVYVTVAFSTWLAADEYREAFFATPEDLQMKLDAAFSDYVAECIRSVLGRRDVGARMAPCW
ncbi:MAG: hypothetical protein HY791_25700 [Deltaproteobacteria bacterium]|nr:hypothetical protein [Deltaproteobacteria bacterium]